jgi:hypothetical protein
MVFSIKFHHMDNLTTYGPMFLFCQFSKLVDIFHMKTYCCSFYHSFLPRILLGFHTDKYYAKLINVHIIYITLCITINTIMRYGDS